MARSAATIRAFALLACMAVLAACGKDDDDADATASGGTGTEDALPAPTGARGSVTGMPADPGQGTISLGGDAGPVAGPVDGLAPDTAIVSEGDATTMADGMEATPAITGAATSAGPAPTPNPGTDAAAAVIQAYYQALNAGRYDQARSLWADGGGASGQSPSQFAGGFADTAAMDVRVIVPDRVDTSTGVAYADVPVRVTAHGRDGSTREYSGRYTLRAEGDGWRIAATELSETPP
ncbi:YybH family protein [Luteimonas pelagia]